VPQKERTSHSTLRRTFQLALGGPPDLAAGAHEVFEGELVEDDET
jgi:hypothetical protein